jgi:hypothetical protein
MRPGRARPRTWRGAACTVLALATVVMVPATASALPDPEPPPAGAALDEVMAAQFHQMPVTDSLLAAGASDPSFSAVEVDPTSGVATVYRQGGDTGTGAAAYRQAAQGPITTGNTSGATTDAVTGAVLPRLSMAVRPALLTDTQNSALEARLVADVDGLVAQGVAVQSFGRGTAGRPFHIAVTDAAGHRDALLARYATYGAGTVEVVEAQPGELQSNRLRDTAPFYGGGRIRKADGPSGGNCTGGFGVKSVPNGIEYLLTAAHCVNLANKAFGTPLDGAGGNNLRIGVVTSFDRGLDAAFIHGPTNPWIFDGGITNAFTKRVVGTRGYVRGEYVCVSGSFTGVRCEGVQDETDYFRTCYSDGSCASVPVVVYRHARGAALTQPGDSGAPVFIPRADNTTVIARGIHTGGSNLHVTCPNGTKVCSAVGWFVDITRIIAAHHVSLTNL